MSAVLVVAPTAFVAVAASTADTSRSAAGPLSRDRGIGAGRAVSVEMTSTSGASSAPELTLDESPWVAAQHQNKFGKDYPAAAYKK